VILLKFLPALAVIALIVGLVRTSLLFRARAMRAFAARWGLQYIGPSAFRWRYAWGRGWLTLRKIKPPVPIPFSLAWSPANEIRQVWNVIEGQQSGMSIVIFDSIIEGYRDIYRTFVACKTEQNPFEIDKLRDNVVQSHGWTIVYQVPFPLLVPWATWSMSIKRLEGHLNMLQVGSSMRA
jgi:hypothetical protein